MNSSADYARALIARAQDHRYVLERLAGDANAPAWVLGFHAQQAVEKLLKAVLSQSVRRVEGGIYNESSREDGRACRGALIPCVKWAKNFALRTLC